jgi:hypothetical protein
VDFWKKNRLFFRSVHIYPLTWSAVASAINNSKKKDYIMNGTPPAERHPKLARIVCAIVLIGSVLISSPLSAQMPAVPQIPAFLPTVDQVAATQRMPLDGTWLINSIRKKIRIEAGRAYAVDSWVHLFVLKIDPGMVVIKNIVPTGPGNYSGEDLPLMGKWAAKSLADRSLSVTVAGTFGPVNYKLIPMQLDNPQWYAQEMQAAGLTVPTGAPSAQPSYQFTPPGGGAPSAPPAYRPPPAGAPPASPPPPPATGGEDCAETVYDPATDTVSCYKGEE